MTTPIHRIPVRSKQSVLWAVNPFDPAATSRTSAAHLIAALGRGHAQTRVEPIYLLATDTTAISAPVAERAMRLLLKGIKLRGLEDPKILSHTGGTVGSSVEALLKYAKSRHADLIVTGTHARTGLPRLFLGSFAETLLLKSKIPVVVSNPNAHTQRVDDIVFPSDLGPKSVQAFRSVLALAKASAARLTLIHVVPRPMEALLQSGGSLLGGSWMPSDELTSGAEERARARLATWCAEARRHGVKASYVVDARPRAVRDIILERAKKADLIAMRAESGPFITALVGSITRQVVRQAPCPVWVVRAA